MNDMNAPDQGLDPKLAEAIADLPETTEFRDAAGNVVGAGSIEYVPMPQGKPMTEADFTHIEAAAQKRIRKQARTVALMKAQTASA